MENCNAMAPDVAKRLGVIGKNEIEEAVARTGLFRQKKRKYYMSRGDEQHLELVLSTINEDGYKLEALTDCGDIDCSWYTIIYSMEE